mmetsp:Transcript_49558/g.60832  ORF Transcript_49558/g.60832 Transcript_49558/m.60832 type:complete len:358 (-) Transcript_49558:25-1098(-)
MAIMLEKVKEMMLGMSVKKKIFVGAGIGIIGMYFVGRVIRGKRYWQNQFMKDEWKSKAILITGCDTGFGYRTAIKLDEMGYSVVATCLKQDSVDQFLDSDQSSFYVNSIAYKMDVTNMNDINNVKDNLTKYLNDNNKVLWGIVNNAGLATPGTLEMTPLKLIDLEIDVLLKGPFYVTKTFLPLVYGRQHYSTLQSNGKNGGRIVNISSLSAKLPLPGMSRYTACKAGVTNFTHALRGEISTKFGIWVTCIEPGFYKTSIFENSLKMENDVINDCDKEVWKAYDGNEVMSKSKKSLHELQKNTVLVGQNIDDVVDLIIHGLISKYPKRVYKKYGVFGFMTHLSLDTREIVDRMIKNAI